MKIDTRVIRRFLILALFVVIGCNAASAQLRRSPKSYVKGGVLQQRDTTKVDSVGSGGVVPLVDSLSGSLADSLTLGEVVGETEVAPFDTSDSLFLAEAAAARQGQDSLSAPMALKSASPLSITAQEKAPRKPFLSDSMSLSKVSWVSAVLPGFGQIYNKQYWKLPILYGTVGAGIAMYAHENKTYKPLREQYDALLLESGNARSEELNSVQSAMIQSNTRRQLYLGAALASYIYFIGDAAVNYSTNEVSDVKKATTLSMICPGAGQFYNKSYWRIPIVVGMFATTVYVYDWNNRGYKRFQTAYALRLDYENNPENYPDGTSIDEFGGAYSAATLKSYRNSYRRNRDFAIILTAGAYLLQVLDAHVDAHLKDFDISDDLSFNPTLNYTPTSPTSFSAVGGFNLNYKF